MGEFNAQGLADTGWAFATVSRSDQELFVTLARATEQRVGEFTAQGLVSVGWAFAKAAHSDEKLFEVLPRAAERRLGELNACGLANMAWAFASDAQLFRALATAVEQRTGDFTLQEYLTLKRHNLVPKLGTQPQ